MMRPISPVVEGMEEDERTVTPRTLGYPIPVVETFDDFGTLMTRWQPDESDKTAIAAGDSVYVMIRDGAPAFDPGPVAEAALADVFGSAWTSIEDGLRRQMKARVTRALRDAEAAGKAFPAIIVTAGPVA